MVELALGGVEVLRPLVGSQPARTEAQHPPPLVGQRERQPPAEAVVQRAPLTRALHHAGSQQLLVGEPGAARPRVHVVPGAGRVPDAKAPQRGLVQAARGHVRPGVGGLGGLPQVARVVGRVALQQRVQPLPAPAARGRARILVLHLQLHRVAVGQELQGALEVHALGLLDEAKDVAAGSAPEAVVDLLDGVHSEGRSALLVERAQALEPVGAGTPQLRARRHEVDHVDRVADLLLGAVGVHQPENARGTHSASNVRIA